MKLVAWAMVISEGITKERIQLQDQCHGCWQDLVSCKLLAGGLFPFLLK